ncbi:MULTISPECIES: serine hydroxymethyltransferase [unclassified Xanthobacter]|uniref:serine hydroxymethyltransferase n=1 Tax=unclassified Xanthobacter TaxID=2623496 RepID=UPI001F2483E4|nr:MULTISPECIES: serine hydroxymethyltransferase [unclassified Xanthobacter]
MTAAVDSELATAIRQEARRQQNHIELIASENIVSAQVRAAQGSILTNKYAEGYPGRRYHGDCEAVERGEQLAIDRAGRLFGAAHANVQAHSGANANIAVLFALLDPGDGIMGLDLACGGHLPHGTPVSPSGRWSEVAPYSVREDDERIDYDELDRLAREARPRLIFAGGSAYPREIDFARMRAIADAAGAWLVADVAHYAGLIATGLYPNPVPHADVVTSTKHKTLRGPRGGLILTNDAALAKKIDKAVFPGMQGGPLIHVIAAKAASFHEALQTAFGDHARAVVANAQALGDALTACGLRLVTGGTDCHLLLVDLRSFGATGKAAVEALERFGLTTNKNAVLFDPLPPTVTSGIRLGTPAATSRGFDEAAFREVGALTLEVLGALRAGREHGPSVHDRIRRLTDAWPIDGGTDG